MPLYDYVCLDCIETKQLTDENRDQATFETRHGFEPSKAELKASTQCPHCDSQNTVRALSHEFTFYMKGKAWLDRPGMKRDMDMSKLTTKDENGKSNDPYLEHRVPGEADHIVHTLKEKNKKQTKKIVFDNGSKK